MARVALVEDDPNVRSLFVRLLESADLRPAVYDSGDAFLSSGDAGSFDVVVTDFQMPGASGLDVLRTCRAEPDPPEVLLVTGVGTIPNAVEAMRMGAFDYLAKPVPSRELIHRVGLALEARRLRHDVVALSGELRRQQGEPALVGESRAMHRLLVQAKKAAETDSTVLILGETGVGKEVVARHIQKTGRRARTRFLTLNCATLPEDSIENELFGHAPGAFPGATEPKRGLFEEASGGTLLLDEIASLSGAAQAKLLRFFDECAVRRIGENTPRPIDVRVLSTTNRDLPATIAARAFREDLFYRLSVITLVVPPLRERREDIESLALHFLAESVRRHGKAKIFAASTLERLAEYDFPGNVRELRYAIEQAVILSEDTTLRPEDFPLVVPRVTNTVGFRAEELRRRPSQLIDAERLQEAIRQCHGNRLQAAKRLGISRATFYRLLARTGGGKPSDTRP